MRTPPRHLLLALRLPFLLLLLLRPAASTAAQPAPAASRRAFATFSFGAVAGALRLRRLLADSDPSADRVVLVLEHAGRALVDDEGALVAAGLRVVRIAHAQYPRLGWAPHVDSFAGLANVTTYLARGEREKYVMLVAKLWVLNLTQYDQVLYVDSDAVPLGPLDGLFGSCGDDVCFAPSVRGGEGEPGAAPPPARFTSDGDRFNTGVFLARPSAPLFGDVAGMLARYTERPRQGDQGVLNDYLLTCHRELAEERAAACPQPAQRLLAARAPGWAPLPWGANVRPYSVNLLTERALRRGALIAHLCCGWEWAAGCEAHVALAAAAAAGAKPPWFAAAAGPALWAAVGTKLPSDLARMRLVALVLGRILDAETGALGGAGGAAAGGGG